MKKNPFLPYTVAIFAIIIGLASCSEDFESIGTEIVNDQGLNVEVNREATVVAYSRKLSPFRSNNVTKYQLGTYSDPVFGESTANILTQVNLSESDPDFGENAVVDSVYIYIPYFSTAGETEDEVTEYTLDSIYGSSPIRLEFFESTYLLRNLDPTSNFEEAQRYYTDEGSLFEDYLSTSLLEIPEFTPSASEIALVEGEDDDEETTRFAPGLRAQLSSDFFQQLIIDKSGQPELLSNSNFLNYFRGIYIKASNITANGTLVNLNLEEAVIDISYTFDDDDEVDERGTDVFQLTLNSISVNTFDTTLNPTIANDLLNVDRVNGEENLYLRGGEGIMSIIELFGNEDSIGYNDFGVVNQPNGIPDELDEIRQKGWLINEANLVFHVNQDLMVGGETEPERIFIYDFKNNERLTDYDLDPTISETELVDAVTTHLGRLERDDSDNGSYYKVRITNFMNNLVNQDSTGVKLGLVVAQDVINPNFLKLRNIQSPGIEYVPEVSLQSPEGTILYGNATPNEEKRLTLEIYYTDPNQ
ncbi:hypothetical protein SCB49_04755 [unidentified eubacterium SCB49]|nr:hypothetical protein SCB49_04755 [unidentified eubacterium SCB49]